VGRAGERGRKRWGEGVGEKENKKRRQHQLDQVVGRPDAPEGHSHEEQCIRRTSDKEQLHDIVIKADVGTGDEIDITGDEDDEVESLCLE
jgi:hypothetical protein